jgi:uncharacterized protein YkwD
MKSKTIKLSKISKEIFSHANNERLKYDRKKLHQDPILMKAAIYHSRDMAKNGYCGHINKKGESPTDRVIKFGFNVNAGRYCGVGENCGCKLPTGKVAGLGYIPRTEQGIALGFIKQWKKSPPHFCNIINQEYTLTGIGVATIDDNIFYAAQVFYG